ncbi:MAG: HDOD domain-containing protein [Lachnospiraceae bacterium]|nr:HDOD domain-containing protein [Lachnospiraceae bacterium]
MFSTMVPLFDENMAVKAYSIFTEKNNVFLNPAVLGTGSFDGAGDIPGFEMIAKMGIDSLSKEQLVFVPLTNISIFASVNEMCKAPHDRIVLLIDRTVAPIDVYVNRIKELKSFGYKMAIRKLAVSEFQSYAPILALMDYILLNNKRIVIENAQKYFNSLYPNVKLVAGNIDCQERFDELKGKGYDLYEGPFYRVPITQGTHEVSPLKITYLELLRLVNNPDFNLTDAADTIGRDVALTIDLLKVVNRVVKTAEITSIRHAAAMLGQRELKRWINTAVTENLYADRPGEITRLSLLRARFSENLAGVFDLKMQEEELFLMGLFSVLDVILEKPMNEALDMIQVSKPIRDALVSGTGKLALVFELVKSYESADWTEVSRLLLLQEKDDKAVSSAYMDALSWYRDTIVDKVTD